MLGHKFILLIKLFRNVIQPSKILETDCLEIPNLSAKSSYCKASLHFIWVHISGSRNGRFSNSLIYFLQLFTSSWTSCNLLTCSLKLLTSICFLSNYFFNSFSLYVLKYSFLGLGCGTGPLGVGAFLFDFVWFTVLL